MARTGRPKGKQLGATRRENAKIKHYGGINRKAEKENWIEIGKEVDAAFRRFFFKRDLPLPHIEPVLDTPVFNPHEVNDTAQELFFRNRVS